MRLTLDCDAAVLEAGQLLPLEANVPLRFVVSSHQFLGLLCPSDPVCCVTDLARAYEDLSVVDLAARPQSLSRLMPQPFAGLVHHKAFKCLAGFRYRL